MTPKSFDEENLLVVEERNYGKGALLVLEDGTTFSGTLCGAELDSSSSGEVISQFND